MACPVTADDVRAVRGLDDLPPEAVLTPFLKAAKALMETVIECAQNKGRPLSEDLIHSIETYLAAHFSTTAYPIYSSERSEGASATLSIKVGSGLDSTLFGQNAKALDTSGCLQEIADEDTNTAQLFWGGKPVSSQTSYWDRN